MKIAVLATAVPAASAAGTNLGGGVQPASTAVTASFSVIIRTCSPRIVQNCSSTVTSRASVSASSPASVVRSSSARFVSSAAIASIAANCRSVDRPAPCRVAWPTAQSRWARRADACSPASASRSRPNSRTVSSIR
ncbi:hypothetical protein [Candidatus Frankia alpina]|uniref:hypothetical protein n=1 Tax=Candidatus Frankia alpina TaxID=2699483 RepID=UPI001F443E09|nr:hypothetical protein [Candidatus Frankia alpina]